MIRHLLLSCTLLISAPVIAIDLPDMGQSSDAVLSPVQEKQLGEQFMRRLRQQATILDDIELNQYLGTLGQHLASFSDAPGQTFHFFVVKDPGINAFAMLGGYIGLNSGLILKSRNESELASVISHEIAHITQRHLARMLERSERFSLPMMGALIASAILATQNSQAGQAAIVSVVAGSRQMQLNFTRDNEKEADRVGMQILSGAGFDPGGMADFFERLQSFSRYNTRTLPEFLSTHPVTLNRIAEARNRAAQLPRAPAQVDSAFYNLLRARLLVLTEDNSYVLIRKLRDMLDSGHFNDERATRYALAMALLDSREPAGVQAQIDWLIRADSDRVGYRLLQARLHELQNRNSMADAEYQQTLHIYPDNLLISMNYVQFLLRNNQPAQALKLLQELRIERTPIYYRLLAQAYQNTGQTAEATLALVENYYLDGQTQLALDQLDRLLKQRDTLDFYIVARIDARYAELQAILETEEELEEKTE